MSSTDEKAGEPKPIDKQYIDIIHSDIKVDKKYIEETGLPAKIVYYCRDCEKAVKPKRIGKKFEFSCADCKGNNVSFGSEQSIMNYYKNAKKE
jgi:predicted methyltransferase